MITKLWLYPPLAFGRVGPSKTPCDNFSWSQDNLTENAIGKTRIRPAETLYISDDGTVTSGIPEDIKFKDSDGFKPVCPFFELHGEWSKNGKIERGPITSQILEMFNLSARDLTWKIEVANLKPFNYTLNYDDQITSAIEITGDDTKHYLLSGTSPTNAKEPLIPKDRHLPLGSVQLTKSTNEFPSFRLRFTPAAGWVYGPSNLLTERSKQFNIPEERLILNPKASWCNFIVNDQDYRNVPRGLYARDTYPDNRRFGMSLGLVDDICDGVITCFTKAVPETFARIIVGPPKYAPDRRPFTSLADGLVDRVMRNDIFDPAYVSNNKVMTVLEFRDFFERVVETMSNINIDAWNNSFDNPFDPIATSKENMLPLTKIARDIHKYLLASIERGDRDILLALDSIINRIREPWSNSTTWHDRKMPALIRGSDGFPMHITRRQYDLLIALAKNLREADGGNS